MVELKPCPFCGMNARAWSESQSWYVGCIGAFCAAQTKPFCEREEAIEAWNTRAAETPNRERIIELVEELSDLVGGDIDE